MGRSPYADTVLRDLGVLVHVPGLMALASLPVCLAFDEMFAIPALLWTTVVSLILGQGLYWRYRSAGEMQLRHAMVTAVFAWVLIPLIGMIPFVSVAAALDGAGGESATVLAFLDPWNALFESVSGFTSTGLSVASHPSELPHVLLWWRSFMQWVGGVGVIVLILTVFHPSADAERLYFSEARERQIFPDVVSTVRTIWWIYLLFTVGGILLLRAAGMGWWDAVNHGMTGIATGGFSTRDDSIAGDGLGTRAVMLLLIVLGAISFNSHFRILRGAKFGLLWRDAENRSLFILLAAGAILVFLENLWTFGDALYIDSLFQWVSALCTAGFQTVDLQSWSATAQLLLTVGMILGGAAGATTGGLKLARVLVLTESALSRVRRVSMQPWRLMEHKPITSDEDGHRVGPQVEAATLICVLWLSCIGAGSVALLHAGDFTLNQAIFEAASALGNVGLSAGITQTDLSWFGKLILIILMWMGRLEIVPVLVLVSSVFGRNTRRAH